MTRGQRTGLGIGAIALLALLAWIWRGDRAPQPGSEVTAVIDQTPTAAMAPAQVPEAEPAAPATPLPAVPGAPIFEIVRVAPDGQTVIAGKAAPGAAVEVLLDGAKLGEEVADANGAFVAIVQASPSDVARALTLRTRVASAAAATVPAASAPEANAPANTSEATAPEATSPEAAAPEATIAEAAAPVVAEATAATEIPVAEVPVADTSPAAAGAQAVADTAQPPAAATETVTAMATPEVSTETSATGAAPAQAAPTPAGVEAAPAETAPTPAAGPVETPAIETAAPAGQNGPNETPAASVEDAAVQAPAGSTATAPAEDATAPSAPTETGAVAATSAAPADSAANPMVADVAEVDLGYIESAPVLILPSDGIDQAPVVVQSGGADLTLVQPAPAAPDAGLVLDRVTRGPDGDVVLAGRGAAGLVLRCYANGVLLSETRIGEGGDWRTQLSAKSAKGALLLRLDAIGADGSVRHRLETPFDDTDLAVATAARPAALTVQRGDNLWRLAEQVYGEGTRYSVIFAANASLIRDEDLIYPGQVFTLPALAPAQ